MESEFEFLRRLHDDLADIARADNRRMATAVASSRPRHWKGWMGAVASLLVLAGVIGLFIGTSNVRESVVSEGGASFSSVASAVTQPVPGFVPAQQGQHTIVKAGEMQGYTVDQGSLQDVPGTASLAQGSQGGRGEPAVDLSKIIRDGQIAVTIADGTFGSSAAKVSHIAAVNGGSVLSSSSTGGESGSFTLRVPAANFEQAMAQLSQLGTVDSSAVQGQDVTAQFVDLKAHMKIYLARRKVLFGLMTRANTIGETITLQNQLDDVQLKIDQITGQLNYINKQVAESTIKVDLHEAGAAVAESPDAIDNPSLGRAWDRAVQGLLNVLAAVVIGLGYLIPLLVVFALGYAIWRGVQRRRIAADAG
jgi:hypothetical protein